MPGGTFHLTPGTALTKDLIRSFVMATDYGVHHSVPETNRENALFNVLNTIPGGEPAAIADASQSPLVTDSNLPTVIITPVQCTVTNNLPLTDADRAALIQSCSQAATGAAAPEGSADGTAGGVGSADGGNLSTAAENGGSSAGDDPGNDGGDTGGGDTGGGLSLIHI